MAAASPWIFEVDEGQFDDAVLERSRTAPVVVDFWAPWCGPCRMLAPILEELVRERKGEVLLAKINVDDNQNLAAEFGVSSIPMVVAFKDGRPVLEFMGLLPEAQLRDFLDQLVPSPADRLAAQARALEETNPEQAEALYHQALEQDRQHPAAQLGLARLLLKQGQAAQAREILDNLADSGEEVDRLKALLDLHDLASLADETTARQRLEADPDNPLTCYELGCVLAAKGQYTDALALLLSAGERDRKLAAGKVREAMVKIFQAVGVRDPLADEYRDKLTALLY